MNDDSPQSHNTPVPTDNGGENDSARMPTQVFDISSDNISPVSDTDTPASEPAGDSDAIAAQAAADIDSAMKNSVRKALDKELGGGSGEARNYGSAAPAAAETPRERVAPSPFTGESMLSDSTKPVTPAKAAAPTLPKAPLQELPKVTVFSQMVDHAEKKNVTPVPHEALHAQTAAVMSAPKPPETPVIRPMPTAPAQAGVASDAKSIRTYEADVADAISHKGTTTASIAIAESRKKEGEDTIADAPEGSGTGKKLAFLGASLLLVAGGAFGAYYLYSRSPLAPATHTTQQSPAASSVIPSDNQVGLAVDGLNTVNILTRIEAEIAKPQAPNTIKEIVPYTTDQNGVKTRVSATDMLRLADIQPPDILTRSLTQSWMLGVYADVAGAKSVFVVATDNFFQNAFAGMLQWESVMADDLKLYLAPGSPKGIANVSGTASSTGDIVSDALSNLNGLLPTVASSTGRMSSTTPATSTASSTSPSTQKAGSDSASTTGKTALSGSKSGSATKTATTSKASLASSTTATSTATSTISQQGIPVVPYFTIRGQFQDRIVKNKDVREFVTADGTVLFLYSFVDNGRLVVAPSEAVLSALIDRLDKQAFIR